MAEEKQAYVTVGYKVDQASVSAVDKAVSATESRLVALSKSTAAVGDAATKTGKTLQESFTRSESAIKADQKAVDDLRKALGEAADEADNLNKTSSGGGKIGVEGLRRTGGALRQLGLEGPGEAVGKIGDVAEVGKELKNLGDAAKGLPGVLGSVASAGAAVGGSFGAIILVAGPVALALADAAIAFKLIEDSANKAAEAEKQRYEQEVQDIQRLAELRQKARTESSQQSAQETGDLVKSRQDYVNQLNDLKTRKAANDAAYTNLGGSFNPADRRRLDLVGQQLDKEITDTLGNIDKLNKGFVQNTTVLDPLIQKHEAERKAVQDLLNVTDAKSEADRLQIQALDRIKSATEGRTAVSEKELQAITQNIQAASKNVEDTIAQKQAEIAKNNELIASLEKLGPDNESAVAKIKDLQAANAKLTVETDQLTKVTLPLIKARQDEAAAAAKDAAALAAAQADAIKGTDEFIKNQQKYADLIATGSSEQVNARIDAIERERKAIQDGLPTLDALGESNEEARKKAEEYRKQLDKLNEEQGQLTSNILPLIEAREAESRVIEVQKKFNDEAAKIEEQDTQARTAALQKKNDSLTDIERKSLETRADLQGKYNNSLVDLARKSADEAADTLRKLEQQRADLSTSLTRDEQKSDREAADKSLELRIKAAREDERANREHYQRLEDIRRAAQDREADLILNRDFLGLFQSRRQTTRDLESENTNFVNKQTEASLARQQEAQDEQRAIEIQRRERLIAYQNQVQDLRTATAREIEQQHLAQARQEAEAQLAYEREIAQQRVAKERQINELKISYGREIDALNAKTLLERTKLQVTYDQELALAASYGKARVDNERKVQEALLAQARSRLAALNGGSTGPVMRAEGGGLAAGQAAFVNETGSSGRETFSSAAGTIALPGFGLFTPLSPGTVNANRNSSFKVDMPVTINESRTPQATADKLRPMVYDVLEELTQP